MIILSRSDREFFDMHASILGKILKSCTTTTTAAATTSTTAAATTTTTMKAVIFGDSVL